LAALLTACAAAGSFEQGIAYGFMFGLGAALTPLFIILPLLGRFAQQLRVNQPWLERWLVIFGGSVLVVMGLYRISLMV
jgi:cytochrome c biogenesis protein CcdA